MATATEPRATVRTRSPATATARTRLVDAGLDWSLATLLAEYPITDDGALDIDLAPGVTLRVTPRLWELAASS